MKKLKEIKKMLHEYNDNWWNNERKDLDLKYYITTDFLCDLFEEFEIDNMGIADDEICQYCKDKYGEEVESGNTYNWNFRVQNDFNFEFYKNEDKYICLLMFHICGDIRANYTDYVMLEFDSIYQFWDILNDSVREEFAFEVNVDDKTYLVELTMGEDIDVWDFENEEEFSLCAYDDSELAEEIRKRVKEK